MRRSRRGLLGFELAGCRGLCGLLGGNFADQARKPLGFCVKLAGLAGENLPQQAAHLLAHFGVTPGLGRLALERCQLLFDLDVDIVHARQIQLGRFQLGLGQALLGFVLGDAGGFLDDGAAVGRLGAEHLPDAALLDDGVGVRAQPDAHEEVLDIAQTGGPAIDEVLALPGAVQPAADDHFTGTRVEHGWLRGALLAERAHVAGRFRIGFRVGDGFLRRERRRRF